MTIYQFQIGQLETTTQQGSTLFLHAADGPAELRVRVCPTDAQLIALVLAGLATPATRLAQLVQRMAEQLDARVSHVLLQRNRGNLVEANLVLRSDLEPVLVPLTFGDAVVLAHVNALPIHGDDSLVALLRMPPEPEAALPPPPAFAAFFDSLGTV